MARRRGSFGRRRYRASSLTALIASLAREQRAAEDRAIFDAYQNGGRFNGQLVTDDVILKYIRDRRDSFDKSDALWDEWNNRLIQTEFSVGEQKIGLKFKEGKVGAGAVAAFYRDQLKKIPKNSAFYREVAGRAAEWAKSAASAARGRARGRARSGINSRLNAEIQKAQSYLDLEKALTDYAIRQGIISPGDSLTDADATELREMFNRGIYVGKDQLTFGEFRQAARGYYANLNRQVALQVAKGNQGVEARRKRDKHLYGTILKLNAVDDRAAYELLREAWLGDLKDANGDPYAIAEANKKYAKGLETIGKNASKPENLQANDPEFISGIRHELNALNGKESGPSVAELYGEEGDTKATVESVTKLNDDIKLLDSNKAYYGQTEPGGTLGVVQWPTGLGADPLGLDDSLQPSVTVINGVRRVVYLKGQEINAAAIIDVSTGSAIPFSPANIDTIRNGLRTGQYERVEGPRVGYAFTNPTTGKVVYGVHDPTTGKMFFTEANPFASDVIGAGDELVVFTNGIVQTEDGRGSTVIRADLTTAFKNPTAIAATGSPVLSDGSVTPKDMLQLLNSGQLAIDEEDIEQYRLNLENAARRAGQMDIERDRWWDDSPRTFTPDLRDSPSERTRDARAFQLPNVQSYVPNLQNMFARPQKDDLYVPPPAPKPPAPKPPAPTPVRQPPKPPAPKPPKPPPSPHERDDDLGYRPPQPPHVSGRPDTSRPNRGGGGSRGV